MKKYNYYLMIVYLLSISSLISCKKELYPARSSETVQTDFDKKRALVVKAKDWYESHDFKRPASGKVSMSIQDAADKIDKKLIGTIDWSKATFVKYDPSIPDFIRVPLMNYDVNCSYAKDMSPNGYRDILFREKSNGDYDIDVLEIHPDEAYIAKKRKEDGNSAKEVCYLVAQKDFTGYFLVYTTSNVMRYGERRENGLTVGRFKL